MEFSPQGYARPIPYEPVPLEVVQGTAPAAGSGFAVTNPGRAGWILVAVLFRLVASAAVANRVVTVDYDDGNGLHFLSHAANALVTAGQTRDHVFSAAIGSAYSNGGNDLFAPLFPWLSDPGRALQINVANMDVADQLSNIVLVFARPPTASS